MTRKYSVQTDRTGRCIDRASVFVIGLILAAFAFLAGLPMTILAYTYEQHNYTVAQNIGIPTKYLGLSFLAACPLFLFADFIFYRLYLKERGL